MNLITGLPILASTLPDSEHLGATCGANALSRRLAILHSYRFGILHFPLGTALHTVCLHYSKPPFCMESRLFLVRMSTLSLYHTFWLVVTSDGVLRHRRQDCSPRLSLTQIFNHRTIALQCREGSCEKIQRRSRCNRMPHNYWQGFSRLEVLSRVHVLFR